MGGLCLLFWLIKRAKRFYQKVEGVKHEEAWGNLIGFNVLRFYNQFEGLRLKVCLSFFLTLVAFRSRYWIPCFM
jgi:hypothetical protein